LNLFKILANFEGTAWPLKAVYYPKIIQFGSFFLPILPFWRPSSPWSNYHPKIRWPGGRIRIFLRPASDGNLLHNSIYVSRADDCRRGSTRDAVAQWRSGIGTHTSVDTTYTLPELQGLRLGIGQLAEVPIYRIYQRTVQLTSSWKVQGDGEGETQTFAAL